MKFDMGSSTLSNLGKETSGSNQDLGGLLKQLVSAVEPLEGKFNGSGRAAFDNFKGRTDIITRDLNLALAAIVEGQSGMNTAFITGDQESSDNATRNASQADFTSAKFSARR